MSNQIELPYNETNLDLYAIIRNYNTGQVYNGSGLENYLTGNINTYDIAMTEQGTASRFYIATFPAIAAGIYQISIYKYVGANPLETDRLVGSGFIDWDGSSVVTVNSDAISLLDLANGIESGFTLRESLRLILATLAGKLDGALTNTITIRDINDTKNRITATVDQDGNRLTVTTDVT